MNPQYSVSPITRRQFVRTTTSVVALSLLTSCSRSILGRRAGAGSRIPDILLKSLKSDDYVIAADSARLLGALRSPGAVGPLIDYVRTHPYAAKTAGLEALAHIGDPSITPDLRPLVADPRVKEDPWWYGYASCQTAAALALMALGDDYGVPFLMDETKGSKEWALLTWFGPMVFQLESQRPSVHRLKARFTVQKILPETKADPGQLVVIYNTLAFMRTNDAYDALRHLTDHVSRYVRGRAAVCLLEASTESADLRRVSKMARHDPTIFARIKAAQALGDIESILSALGQTMDPLDRAAAIEALGMLGDAAAFEILQEQFEDDYPYIRLCTVEAMERIGTRAAIRMVARHQGDTDLRVRLHVAKCLAAHEANERSAI